MMRKKFSIILTVVTLVACLFLHINGFFRYEWTHSAGIETTDLMNGSFSYLLINIGAGPVFTYGATAALIASIVLVWLGFRADCQTFLEDGGYSCSI